MENLTIKELAAYLPYGLKADSNHTGKLINTGEVLGIDIIKGIHVRDLHQDYFTSSIFIKPILYPLSSLTKEITINGETFVPIEYFLGEDPDLILNAVQIKDISYISYNLVQKLLSWKFDIFNLIERGLAIEVTETFNPYR